MEGSPDTRKEYAELTDEELARSVQQGDTEPFGELMVRYEKKLARYGTKFFSDREDITDLVQETFVKVYQNIQSFDASLKFSPWIYRIAHNEFVSALRKKSRRPLITVDFDTFLAHPVYEDTTISDHEQKEMRALIEKGLAELKPKYREVLVLFYLEELSYNEIADVLRVPVSTVGIRLKRAREALEAVYKKQGHTYEPAS